MLFLVWSTQVQYLQQTPNWVPALSNSGKICSQMFTYLTGLVNPVSFLRCPSFVSPLRHKLHSLLWPANINHQRLYCTEEALGKIVADISLPDYKPHDPLTPMTVHASVNSHCPVSAVFYPLVTLKLRRILLCSAQIRPAKTALVHTIISLLFPPQSRHWLLLLGSLLIHHPSPREY